MDAEYNLTESAKRLGIDPKTLRRWLDTIPIKPPKGYDRRSRVLTEDQLQSIADKYERTLKADHTKTNLSHDVHLDLSERNLNQFRAEIRDTKSEVNSLKEWLNHLTRRLQDQEDKANQEIRAMHQKISDLTTRFEKHLDQH